jgi:hypothetical protein
MNSSAKMRFFLITEPLLRDKKEISAQKTKRITWF